MTTKALTILIISLLGLFSFKKSSAQQPGMMIRISEIEIFSSDLEAYKKILKEESEASVKLEPGVIAIFPMTQKENQNQIRILEIYQNSESYQSHLKTPHFLKYKSSTLRMVKSLKLIDMDALDSKTMTQIFKKLKENN